MPGLSVPSKKLASKIVTEVEFEERLIGYRLRQRTGLVAIALYSFEEIIGLLYDQHPRIDFVKLESWMRKIMEDIELSEKIGAVIKTDCSVQNKSLKIRELMSKRLLQCRQIV